MAAGDLTDLASVKAWIPALTGSASDSQLSGLITAASTWLVNYLGRQILSAAYVETVQGAGHDFMLLRQGPVTVVTSVAWQGTTLTATGDPITPAPGFYVDSDGRTLRLVGYCFPYRQAVRVSYTAGFATAPADVAQACIELVGEAFKRRERIGVNAKTLGGQETITFQTSDMSAPTKSALNNYRFVSPL